MAMDWGEDMEAFLEWRKANPRTPEQRTQGADYRAEKSDMDLGHDRWSRWLGAHIPAWDPEPGQDPGLFR